MKLTIESSDLKTLIKRAAASVTPKSPMAILTMVKLEATSDGQLAVTGSNLETTVSTSADADNADDAHWSCCVSAEKLKAIGSALPAGKQVTLSLSDKSLSVSCERSRWRLSHVPGDDYPQPNNAATRRSGEPDPVAFKSALERVVACAAVDDVRFFLNGVLLDIDEDGMATAVATDGHRAGTHKIPTPVIAAGDATKAIIPLATVKMLIAALEPQDTRLTLSEGAVELAQPGYRLHSRLVEGSYPEWQRVFPSEAERPGMARFDRKALLGAVSNVALLSEKHGRVTLDLSAQDVATISAHDKDHDDGRDEAQMLDHQPANGSQQIAVNGAYLYEILRSSPCDEVTLRYGNDAQQSLVITDEDERTTWILMPIRV